MFMRQILMDLFQNEKDVEDILRKLEQNADPSKDQILSATQAAHQEGYESPETQHQEESDSHHREDEEFTQEEETRAPSPPDDILASGNLIQKRAIRHNIKVEKPPKPEGILEDMLAPPTESYATSILVNKVLLDPVLEEYKIL